MLYVYDASEPYYVVGARLTYSGTLGSVTSVDPVSYAIKTGRAMFLSQPVNLSTLIGRSYTGQRVEGYVGHSPVNPPYVPLEDAKNYGSLSTNLSFAYRVLAGQKPFIFDPSGEQNVSHWNVKGTLYPEAVVGLYPGVYPYPTPSWGYTGYKINTAWNRTVPIRWLDNLPNNLSGWQNKTSITTDALGWPTTVPSYASGGGTSDIFDSLDWYFTNLCVSVPANLTHTRTNPLHTVWITYSNYVQQDTGPKSGLRSYDYELKIKYNGVTTTGNYRVTWRVIAPIPSFTPRTTDSNSTYSFLSGIYPTCTYTITCLKDGDRGWSEFASLPDNGGTDVYQIPYNIALVSGPSAQGGAVKHDTLQNNLWSELSTYGYRMKGRMPDLRPAAFHTTASAVEELINDIDTNMIEAIVELHDVASMLPEMGSLVSAVANLRSGRPLASVRDLLDFITALRLQQRFAWDPTIDLLEGGVERFARAYATLADKLSGNIPMVGRSDAFPFKLPGTILDGGRLVVRTKVVADSGLSQNLQRILGIRALGFLPSGSSVWDLIPLSFVVDWFVNIGGRLRDLESLALLCAIGPKVVVHSYCVDIPLDTSALTRLGLVNYQSYNGEAIVRLFVREVSQHMPPIRNGSIDFALPVDTPNWATAGSLLWQLA